MYSQVEQGGGSGAQGWVGARPRETREGEKVCRVGGGSGKMSADRCEATGGRCEVVAETVDRGPVRQPGCAWREANGRWSRSGSACSAVESWAPVWPGSSRSTPS